MEKQCGGMPGHEVNKVEAIEDGPIVRLATQYARTGVWTNLMGSMDMRSSKLFWTVVRNMDRRGIVAR